MSPKYCSLAVDDIQALDGELDTEFTPDLRVIHQRYVLAEASNTMNDVVAISGRITVSF